MPIQSQISAELDPLPDAGELLGWAAGAGAVALGAADGWAVAEAVALGEKLALLLGTLTLLLGEKLATAPPAPLCPHPAARNPIERTAANRTGLLASRRMPDPPFTAAGQKPLAWIFQ
jgi:hypothetical protein